MMPCREKKKCLSVRLRVFLWSGCAPQAVVQLFLQGGNKELLRMAPRRTGPEGRWWAHRRSGGRAIAPGAGQKQTLCLCPIHSLPSGQAVGLRGRNPFPKGNQGMRAEHMLYGFAAVAAQVLHPIVSVFLFFFFSSKWGTRQRNTNE